jgi:hypothetical protein
MGARKVRGEPAELPTRRGAALAARSALAGLDDSTGPSAAPARLAERPDKLRRRLSGSNRRLGVDFDWVVCPAVGSYKPNVHASRPCATHMRRGIPSARILHVAQGYHDHAGAAAGIHSVWSIAQRRPGSGRRLRRRPDAALRRWRRSGSTVRAATRVSRADWGRPVGSDLRVSTAAAPATRRRPVDRVSSSKSDRPPAAVGEGASNPGAEQDLHRRRANHGVVQAWRGKISQLDRPLAAGAAGRRAAGKSSLDRAPSSCRGSRSRRRRCQSSSVRTPADRREGRLPGAGAEPASRRAGGRCRGVPATQRLLDERDPRDRRGKRRKSSPERAAMPRRREGGGDRRFSSAT